MFEIRCSGLFSSEKIFAQVETNKTGFKSLRISYAVNIITILKKSLTYIFHAKVP